MALPILCRGRLAPSPTGFLHLGNAWAFLLAWLACRAAKGQLVLRMEDIDPARSRPEFAEAIVRDLHWLGLDWDEGPFFQSARGEHYANALKQLSQVDRVYPCFCTRRELRDLHNVAGAPHVDERGAFYPGTCRHLTAGERQQRETIRAPGWRLSCPDAEERILFDDLVYGPQAFSLAECGGDFLLRRSDGVWAYQLAVVVDDGLMGVNQVVRGHDILPSTPRQLLLARWLGFASPTYAHVPLLCDAEGERLAKRHASLTLASLREAGWSGEQVVGLLARLARLQDHDGPVHARELLSSFSLQALPREPLCLPPMSELLRR